MRERKVQFKTQLKALLFASWIQCCSGMESPSAQGGQGENVFLQQMTVLATAATNAASAAEKAISAMSQSATSSTSASGGQEGLQAAARILKNPDTFSGDDPLSFIGWKFTFCSWLSYGDVRFQKCFDNLEKLGPDEQAPPYFRSRTGVELQVVCDFDIVPEGQMSELGEKLCKDQGWFQAMEIVASGI